MGLNRGMGDTYKEWELFMRGKTGFWRTIISHGNV